VIANALWLKPSMEWPIPVKRHVLVGVDAAGGHSEDSIGQPWGEVFNGLGFCKLHPEECLVDTESPLVDARIVHLLCERWAGGRRCLLVHAPQVVACWQLWSAHEMLAAFYPADHHTSFYPTEHGIRGLSTTSRGDALAALLTALQEI
jgi:hypothetical protein